MVHREADTKLGPRRRRQRYTLVAGGEYQDSALLIMLVNLSILKVSWKKLTDVMLEDICIVRKGAKALVLVIVEVPG